MTSFSVHPRRNLFLQTLDSTAAATTSRIQSVQRIANSGFDAAHLEASTAATTAANGVCKPSSSDCGGSSSGLGGMTKHDIVSSDESSLASDIPVGVKAGWVIPGHPVLVNNVYTPVFMSCNTVPTSSTSPTPMFFDQARSNLNTSSQRTSSSLCTSNNDLFVHVQTGETLSIVVGNDIQHIFGPATVRMVNQAGMSPSALPLHVPPGHMVQQMVDEQGILRHLILSPETTPVATRLLPTAPLPPTVNSSSTTHGSGATTPLKPFVHNSPSPPIVPPYPPPTLPYFVHTNSEYIDGSDALSRATESSRKTWIANEKKVDEAPIIVEVAVTSNAVTGDEQEQSQSGASASEEEEWERLCEMLSRMQLPQILRVAAKEADIAWQGIDTSEASAFGGPFPQIDASEFTYEIVLFENVSRAVSSYRCEPDAGNRVRLCRLRPNTDYYVQLRASLEERGLQGKPSAAKHFKTLTTVPECPHPPHFVSRTHNSITIAWRSAVDNGSPILCYRLEIAKEPKADEEECYELVYEGEAEQTKIKGLMPATNYRVRLFASNKDGDSAPSASVTVFTAPPHNPPKQPQCPQLVSLTSNFAKLSWNTMPHHSYSLQIADARSDNFSMVHERVQQSNAAIKDLTGNEQYKFRLIAHNDAGDSIPSEPLLVHTPAPLAILSNSPPLTPSKPHVITNSGKRLEIGWKFRRVSDKDSIVFTLQGTVDEKNWDVLYKGSCTSIHVSKPDVRAFRVSADRKELQSGWSEILRLRREEEPLTPTPGQCAAPTLSEVSKGCLRVQWDFPQGSTTRLLYQLNRVNLQPSCIIYQGEATMFDLVNCEPGEEVEVQVRALAITRDNVRLEGEWSRVSVGRVAAQPPSPPTDVRVDSSNTLHWGPPNSTNGAQIIEYIVERTLICSSSSATLENGGDQMIGEDYNWKVRRTSVDVCSLNIAEGCAGCKYQLSVCAVNSSGISVPSECVYVSISPRAPNAPPSFHVLPQGCRQLQTSWQAPCCNGSEILKYCIRVLDVISDLNLLEIYQTSSACECVIDSLEPDRTYRLSVCGVNAIGMGEPSWASATTLAPPPEPPTLTCSEAGSSYLKLKWKSVSSNGSPLPSNCYYYLEKENDSGKFSPIYEGDNKYTKVRNLNESTKYRFRIRCSSRVSGAGPWSLPFEFTTEQLPPPTIRSAPIVTEVASGVFQVEWLPVRGAPTIYKESLVYRLQIASRVLNDRSNNAWKTIYEGVSTSYSLSSSENAQLRVQCVRTRDGVESVSSPSAIQFVTPSVALSSKQSQMEIVEQEALAIQDISKMQWIQYHILSDKHYAFVILMLFAVLAFVVALALDAFLYEPA